MAKFFLLQNLKTFWFWVFTPSSCYRHLAWSPTFAFPFATFMLTTVLCLSRCGEAPWPECATGGWKRLSLSCGHTGATRWSRISARSTGASRTLGPWRIMAGTWNGPHPQKSCASLRRHSGASTAGSSSVHIYCQLIKEWFKKFTN